MLDRIDGAGELDQHAIAHQLDHAAVVLGGRRIEDLLAKRFKLRQRTRLVLPHHPAVTDDIGS